MSNFLTGRFFLTCYVTLFSGLYGFGFGGVCCNGELDFDLAVSSGEAAWPGHEWLLIVYQVSFQHCCIMTHSLHKGKFMNHYAL